MSKLPQKSIVRLLILVISIFPAINTNIALSQSRLSAKKFDRNMDEVIDESEQRRLVLELINPPFIEIDTDADGIISEKEMIDAFVNPNISITDPNTDDNLKINRLKIANDELNQRRSLNGGQLSVEEANRYIAIILPEEITPDGGGIAGSGLRLRRDIEDVTIIDALSPIREADAAEINFVQDFEANNSVINIRAGVFYPFLVSTGKIAQDELTLTRYQISPGIGIDRVENSASDEADEDILTFALNTDFEVQGSSLFPSQYFRGNFLYETDLDFESSIIGAIFQWEPTNRKIGLGAGKKIFGDALRFRWRALIESQLSTVLDAGNIEGLTEDDFIFRIGPKIEIEFFPNTNLELLNRFGLQAEYIFLQAITGDSETSDLFSTTLSYRLDDNGNANFVVNYRVGETALSGQDVEELSVGLGFTF